MFFFPVFFLLERVCECWTKIRKGVFFWTREKRPGKGSGSREICRKVLQLAHRCDGLW